jgi:hypothetical protein
VVPNITSKSMTQSRTKQKTTTHKKNVDTGETFRYIQDSFVGL